MSDHLTQKIHQQAKKTPIRLDYFMSLCLNHEETGYYQSGNRIGVEGDFTTAPEISQLFGEMLAIWVIDAYRKKNIPKHKQVSLVEIGAGRGSLMLDMLTHVKKLAPDIYKNASFHIIEINETFIQIQQERLKQHSITWHKDIDALKDNYLILWGNEFLDALPIRQFHYKDKQWHETYIQNDAQSDDNLQFCYVALQQQLPYGLDNIAIKEDAWLEYSPMAIDFTHLLAQSIQKNGGIALLIDYGDAELTRDAPSLQAVNQHLYASPLENLGNHDLTAHVNFALLHHIIADDGLDVKFSTQEYFLTSLGINERAKQLTSQNAEHEQTIKQDLHRLISPHEMGELFKIMIITDK